MANFYHSFPRRKREDNGDQTAKGLAILASILDLGFLLTPERLAWGKEEPGQRTLESYARRMCFTLLEERELPDHSKLFGSFAIVLSVDSLLTLGGLPALYLPQRNDKADGLSGLGTIYLTKLAEIERLLRGLAATEQAVLKSDHPPRNLKFRISETGLEEEINCTTANAAALLKCWTERNKISGATELYQAFMSFVELVYPAGNEQRMNVGQLGYYQQREWKISGQLTYEGERLSQPLDQPEQDRLFAIDEEFFGKQLQFLSEARSVADRCLVFKSLANRPVRDFIQEIIVPADALEETKNLLKDRGSSLPLKAL